MLEDENSQGSQPETEPGVAYGKKGESVGGAVGGLFFGKGGAAIGGMIGGWLEDNLGGGDDDDGDKGDDDDKGGGSDDDDISIDGGSLECRIVIQCPRPGVD